MTALGTDLVQVSGTGTGTFVDKNAALDKAVTVTGYTLTGADAGNYTVVAPTGLTANISRAALTITANDASKTFDGTAYSGGNGVTYSGFVNGETPALLAGTLTYGGTSQGAVSVGTYSIIPGGVSAANYSITFFNGKLTINSTSLAAIANAALAGVDLTQVPADAVSSTTTVDSTAAF